MPSRMQASGSRARPVSMCRPMATPRPISRRWRTDRPSMDFLRSCFPSMPHRLSPAAAETSARAAFAVWLGTPLLFYMYLAPGFSHACSAFAVAAFVVAWLHVRREWAVVGVAALGAMAALMGMVREQDLFIAIGPAADYVLTTVRSAPARSVMRP